MSTLSEIQDQYRHDLLAAVKQGNSFFGEVPTDIGSILYCDSTNTSARPLDKETIKKKTIITVLVSLCIVALIWLLLHHSLAWATALSAIVAIVAILIIVNASSFSGKDFFVGTEGFATMKFDKTRDNITEKKVLHFKDCTEFATGEVYKKLNYSYNGTDYFGAFLGKPYEEHDADLLFEFQGTYSQEKPEDDITDQEYLFMKEVEKSWTNYKIPEILASLAANGSYTFNLIVPKENSSRILALPHITVTKDSIEIGGRVYNHETLKNMYFSNGSLIVEHVNHSKVFFGLIEKGQKEEIPLKNIGNRMIFLMFLKKMTSCS